MQAGGEFQFEKILYKSIVKREEWVKAGKKIQEERERECEEGSERQKRESERRESMNDDSEKGVNDLRRNAKVLRTTREGERWVSS